MFCVGGMGEKTENSLYVLSFRKWINVGFILCQQYPHDALASFFGNIEYLPNVIQEFLNYPTNIACIVSILYGSHQAQAVIESQKCVFPELKCALRVKYGKITI